MQKPQNSYLGSLPSHSTANAVMRTALLAGAVFLIPVLLGIFFVFAYQHLSPAAARQSASGACVTNQPAATNLAQFVALRRELRGKGLPVGDLNLRIWAARATEPERLFNVPPPEEGRQWNWHLSQDSRYAAAVSVQLDTLGRPAVGLYDLILEKWLWKKTLPWPGTHEALYVFNRCAVLRYTQNAQHFAMEISADGQITMLDKLPASSIRRPPPAALAPLPVCSGNSGASKNGVVFAVDAQHQNLIGHAQERLPGLRYAGKGDDNTLFSGNGLLKFTVRDGRVTVSDSLTQTVLQQTVAWPNSTNTVVTGALTTHDGSQLSVFLKTTFVGTPSAMREWSVSLSLYTGTVMQSFNADALLAKPRRALQREARSPDGQWLVTVTPKNELSFTSQLDKREAICVSLTQLLGLQNPLSHLAFLEEGRHLALRQGDNFWLLDFDVARGYADLLDRKAANAEALTPSSVPAKGDALSSRTASVLAPASDPSLPPTTFVDEPDTSIPSALALRAEWFADNQAWHYAAALLEETRTLQQYDYRAPRVNPLLQARCYLLSGQRQKARSACREALGYLVSDPTEYNRMIRYQLQGILFAKP